MTDQDTLAARIHVKIGAAKFDLHRLSTGRAGDPLLQALREALDRAHDASANVVRATETDNAKRKDG